jgi:predicted RNA-binding protein associated with RNAse of E/G family
MRQRVTVLKLRPNGEVAVRYTGEVLRRDAREVVLEASFGFPTMALDYVTLKTGDRFVEHFYADRWYNIFPIYDVDGGAFKGWYCNVTRPAEFAETAEGLQVRAVDLALDYFVQPAGSDFVLDEDEFAVLDLAPEERSAAEAALAELRQMARAREGPFEA